MLANLWMVIITKKIVLLVIICRERAPRVSANNSCRMNNFHKIKKCVKLCLKKILLKKELMMRRSRYIRLYWKKILWINDYFLLFLYIQIKYTLINKQLNYIITNALFCFFLAYNVCKSRILLFMYLFYQSSFFLFVYKHI